MAGQPKPVKVYVGWDSRESAAYDVACASLLRHASVPVSITPLKLQALELAGLMRRPRRMRTADNGHVLWDDISQAAMATEFAITRFLTPLLAQSGWALFVDADVVFEADVAALFALAEADPEHALVCVQHKPLYCTGLKMDGQVQSAYQRKNWSSVMLFNCDHPANGALTLDMINRVPGRDLHRFCWLDDHWIGALPAEWNWLVGVQPRPGQVKVAHFTLGGPWIPGWKRCEHDELWLAAAAGGRPTG